jgi:hypothetical protein
MKRRLVAVADWAARVVRGLWPDRNPLRRSLDRVEAVAFGVLAVVFLAGAPLVAVAGQHIAYSVGAQTVQAQRSWRQVPAVLLADARVFEYATVRARWTAPEGAVRTGTIFAPSAARRGSTVKVWVDTSGNPTGSPPLQLSQIRRQATLAAVLSPLVLAEVLLGVASVMRLALDRRRLAAWDFEWQVTEPQWTRRKNA